MKSIRLETRDAETAVPGDEAERDRESLLAALALAHLSRRIEGANGSSPHLLQTASNLGPPDGDTSERALALRANEELLKPRSATTDRTLLMRLGQRFESAPQLSVLFALALRHRDRKASLYHLRPKQRT
jgi:hypothetical protein